MQRTISRIIVIGLEVVQQAGAGSVDSTALVAFYEMDNQGSAPC